MLDPSDDGEFCTIVGPLASNTSWSCTSPALTSPKPAGSVTANPELAKNTDLTDVTEVADFASESVDVIRADLTIERAKNN